jgi:hypothetical protein
MRPQRAARVSRPSEPDVAAIPGGVDAVFIAIPRDAVINTVLDAAERRRRRNRARLDSAKRATSSCPATNR